MTSVLDQSEAFAVDALAGFGSVYSRLVRWAPGGVVRATVTPPGKVAVPGTIRPSLDT
jgi:D-erythrulose 4-kinase